MASKLFDLTGKTALVTGGTRGIGQAMAMALAEAGADIVIIQRSSSDTETKDKITSLSRSCTTFHCELSDKSAVSQLISTVTSAQRIDILVNAAGILKRMDAVEYSQEVFEDVMQVNLGATFTLCRDVGKYWIENGIKGRIVNLASLTSFMGSVRLVGYAMSKGGVAQLTKALSNEWAVHGINVNAIAPGYVATDMNSDTRGGDPAYLKSLNDRIPAGRWGKPEDFKGPVVFLASEASAYVTGHVLTVDGGFMGR